MCPGSVLVLLHIYRARTTIRAGGIYVSCITICVLTLLFVCPHTTIYMCPLLLYVSSYYHISNVLMLLYAGGVSRSWGGVTLWGGGGGAGDWRNDEAEVKTVVGKTFFEFAQQERKKEKKKITLLVFVC